MSTRRSRRAPAPSPTAMIVNFFLDAPLEQALPALELAQTLMARRQAPMIVGAKESRLVTLRVTDYTRASIAPPFIAPPGQQNKPQTLPSTYEEITAPAVARQPAPPVPPAPPAGAPKPRQRARRSDAGQPRKRPTASQPRGKTPAVAASQPAAPAPEFPEQDVPLDFTDNEPVLVD